MLDKEERVVQITDPDSDRYSVLRLIDWWDQQRLSEARVMVVGAGALGNEAAKNLALLGVGKIVMVDFDLVEISNLSRAVLLRAEDAGMPKAEAIARRIKDINPNTEVLSLKGDVARDVGLGVFRRMDVVLGCLDNREARRAVNRACWRVGRPWIDGGLGILDGQVQVFQPPDGACYECTLSQRDYELMNVRYSCPPGEAMPQGRYPTTATAASIIAAIQVQEAIKMLHGLPVINGRGAYYSGEAVRLTMVSYPVRRDCPAHETYGRIIELPHRAEELTVNGLLDMVGGEFLALDHPVLTRYYCTECQELEPVYRPHYLVADRVVCPRCGGRRVFDVTARLSAGEATTGLRLAQVGIPPLHVLSVRSARGWEQYELSGDALALGLEN